MTARNPQYAFRLTRASRGDAWLLAQLGKVGEPEAADLDKQLSKDRDICLQSINRLVAIDGPLSLSALFDMDGYKLISATRSTTTGLVTVKFTRSFRRLQNQIIDCEYTFDPARLWLPVEWVESIATPEVARSKRVTQQVLITGRACRIDSTITDTTSRPKAKSMTSSVVCLIEPDDTFDVTKFTLPAFGLPEPPGYESHTTPVYIWLLAVAAVCLGLTVGFRLLARRRAG